jgi:hypothetical protein
MDGAVTQLTETSSTAASAFQPPPKRYSNVNDAELTVALPSLQPVPWLPLMEKTVLPDPIWPWTYDAWTLRVPMLSPYMLYLKLIVAMPAGHALPSYVRVYV